MTRRLSDADFGSLRGWLERRAGLVFDDARRSSLGAVMAERLSASGRAGVLDYLGYVQSSEGSDERQRLLDAVTIQETHFHRNRPQIEALRRHILPDLLSRAHTHGRPLTIWSAGCSTGEEPYTIAMLALEVAESLGHRPPIRIVGTDISGAALETARAATYAGRTIELAEDAALARWFRRTDDAGQRFTVVDEVRQMVDLRLHNLVTDAPPFVDHEVDLVVCRNVTIYFSRETTRDLVGRFHEVLSPGGWLLLGHAETLWQVSDDFDLVPVGEAFAYRKEMTARVPSRRARIGAEPRKGRGARVSAALPRRMARVSAPGRPVAAAPVAERRVPLIDAQVLVDQARTLLLDGRYEEAARVAEVATRVAPLIAGAYVVLGQARGTLGDDAGAVPALRKAIYLDPGLGHAHFLLAGALQRRGDELGARRSYRAAAETLGSSAAGDVGDVLEGRPVAELVALCERLAEDQTAMVVRGT